MSVLEEYRETGFAISGAEDPLPSDLAGLLAAVEASEAGFTTLRLDPTPGASGLAGRLRSLLGRRG